MALETISPDEFNIRLDAANERLRQELLDAQERVRRLDDLIQRKEAFAHKLDRFLIEIEHEEAEITAAEKELRVPRMAPRRRSTPA